jgi:hypothetical protein
MDRMGAADGLRPRLGEAEMAHLALAHEIGHRPHRVLDGRVGIDPVLVVEIDHLHLEPPQARVAGLAHVIGLSADAEARPVGSAHIAELGGEHHLVAPVGDGAAHQLLVMADAVHVGGVEEGHAELDGAVDRGDGLALVAAAIELRHAHAAEAEGGHLQGAESTLLHGISPKKGCEGCRVVRAGAASAALGPGWR